jgi:hypothetical protein
LWSDSKHQECGDNLTQVNGLLACLTTVTNTQYPLLKPKPHEETSIEYDSKDNSVSAKVILEITSHHPKHCQLPWPLLLSSRQNYYIIQTTCNSNSAACNALKECKIGSGNNYVRIFEKRDNLAANLVVEFLA